MRNSLYDALEVTSSSTTDRIKVALRAVVRRFWAVPRDASGDTEEAVRFAALAASILVDPVRRKDYDAALNPGVGAGPWRLPIGRGGSGDAAGEGGTVSQIMAENGDGVSQLTIEAVPPKALPGVDALSEPLPDGSAWGSPLVWAAFALTWLVLWFAAARPFPGWFELSMAQSLLAALAAGVTAYALSTWLSRNQEVAGAVAGLSRLAIIKWRRERSIFLGTPPPQHNTAWIFKLRLMELTRSASGFVTTSNPWRRFAARLIDYALIGVLLHIGIWLIDQMVPVLDGLFILARSVLILPTLVVLIAIPAEALFHRVFGSTPGSWLMSLQLVTGITRPADHAEPSNRTLIWARSMRVAWSGAAMGFWPAALFFVPRNIRRARDTETDWDSSGDSVVMARPLTAPALATGLIILLGAALILLSGWRRDFIAAWPTIVAATVASRTALTGAFPAGNNATTSAAPPMAVPHTTQASAVPVEVARPNITIVPPPVAPSPPVASILAPKQPTPVASAVSSAEAEMARHAAASRARMMRIDGYARQGETARRSGNYEGMQAACQRWTQDQPGNGEAWRCLGLAQFQGGAGREALPALRQSLKLEMGDAQVEAAILSILRP